MPEREGIDERLIARNLIIEGNLVLKRGGRIAAFLGVFGGSLILVMTAAGLIDNVILPALMSFVGGIFGTVLFLMARKNLVRGWRSYIIYILFISIPTYLFLTSHFILPGGAASYLTGPFSYLYFFLIIITGFIYDSRLSIAAGFIVGLEYYLCYLLARSELMKLTGADPTLLQDIVSPSMYFFKSLMMIFTGVTVGALSQHTRRLIHKTLQEQRERQSVTKLFGQFVSLEVMEKIVQEKTELIGECKYVAVLFSDIRDFTAFTETKAPEEVVNHLNRYFNGMVKCITAQGGIVDKFIGDAVMAVFGGLMELENPSESAVKAAFKMREALAELNAKWRENGETEFRTGIGIHYGEVLQGALGSDDRKEFTVIGDAVNTASRIESLTKQYSHSILITGTTYDRLCDKYRAMFKPLGHVRVKGKENKVEIYGYIETA